MAGRKQEMLREREESGEEGKVERETSENQHTRDHFSLWENGLVTFLTFILLGRKNFQVFKKSRLIAVSLIIFNYL